jgi:hypothetical protein
MFSLWKYLEAISNFVKEDCPNCSNILQQELHGTFIQARTNILRESVPTMV